MQTPCEILRSYFFGYSSRSIYLCGGNESPIGHSAQRRGSEMSSFMHITTLLCNSVALIEELPKSVVPIIGISIIFVARIFSDEIESAK